MPHTVSFYKIQNGEAGPLSNVTEVSLPIFLEKIEQAVQKEARIAAYFAYLLDPKNTSPENNLALMIILLGNKGGISLIRTSPLSSPHVRSITPRCPQAHYFERELAEQWGIIPEGHPWLKPVRYQLPYVFWQNEKDPFHRLPSDTVFECQESDFYTIDSLDTHTLSLGPIRYRADQTGHIRLQCHGEQIFFAETALGYGTRGIEKMLCGGPYPNTLILANTISGSTPVTHTLCAVQLHEALAEIQPSERGIAIRTLLLELERIECHTLAISRMSGSVGFTAVERLFLSAIYQIRNIIGQISGNRQAHNLIYPGGVSSDISESFIGATGFNLNAACNDINNAMKIILDTPSFMRKLHCGHISSTFCKQWGLNGLICRASGIGNDARQIIPCGSFVDTPIAQDLDTGGDVQARLMMRWHEIQTSASYIIDTLINLPEDTPSSFEGDCLPCRLTLQPNHIAVAINESPLGATLHAAITDNEGRFLCYKIVDASFRNLIALTHALKNESLYNFELINSSLDIGFNGHDL